MPDTVFAVEFVDENELPTGHEWMLVRQPRRGSAPPRKWLFIKRGAERETVMDAAAALRVVDAN